MTRKISPVAGCVATGVLLLMGATAAHAQTTTGEILGTVKDSQSLAISGAPVTIVNERTGENVVARTNEVGDYLARALPVGSYALHIEQPGFKRYSRTGATLTGGQVLRVDITLEVGAVSDTVVVDTELPPVNVTTSTLDTMIDDKRLVDLPMNGRNMLSLAALTPGVTRDALVNGPSSDQQHINVNGRRGSATNMVLDGQPMYYGHRGQTLNEPPPDSLEEVKVITSGVAAEFGRGFAVISAVSKGGSNAYHGSLWDYFRNNYFDARSFFSSTVPTLRYNQYGGTFGGPIRRNKIFFFGTVQGLHSIAQSVVSSATPPTSAERGGDFSNSICRFLSGMFLLFQLLSNLHVPELLKICKGIGKPRETRRFLSCHHFNSIFIFLNLPLPIRSSLLHFVLEILPDLLDLFPALRNFIVQL